MKECHVVISRRGPATVSVAGFFYLKNPTFSNGSFLVLNISFSYFASSLSGLAEGWQYFLP
jgi:hypothetical protein